MSLELDNQEKDVDSQGSELQEQNKAIQELKTTLCKYGKGKEKCDLRE